MIPAALTLALLLTFDAQAPSAAILHKAKPSKATSKAKAKKKGRTARKRPICGKRKTKLCVKVPKTYRKPKRNQNSAKHPKNPAVTRPTGLGGGPAASAAGAVTWARNQLARTDYAGLCLRFVADAYAFTDVLPASAANFLNDHRSELKDKGNPEKAPPGALMLFRADDNANGGLGHIGISLGGGKMVSAVGKVETDSLFGKSATARYWNSLYVGWMNAPTTWPGRYETPAGDPSDPIKNKPKGLEITAPDAGATVSGSLEIDVNAPTADGIDFQAYYSENPGTADPTWHDLGKDRVSDGGKFSLKLDTNSIPDQGDATKSTVTLAAFVLGDDGQQTTDAPDTRRVIVHNSSTPISTPTPAPSATPAPTPVPDKTAPSVPAGLAASGQTQNALTLGWGASTDASGIASYTVYRNDAAVGTPTATSFQFTNLTCGTSYKVGVQAKDKAGNVSAVASITAATAACPAPPPPAPSVSLTKGAVHNDTDCHSSYCHYLHVTWANFGTGTHSISCYDDDGKFGVSVSVSGASGAKDPCYYGFPGGHVHVVIDGVASNTITW